MALTHRYSLDMQYAYGTGDNLNDLSASAVDSKSSPVAGGVAYSRHWGNPSASDVALNRVAMGFAYAISPRVALGATAKTIRGTYNRDASRREVDLYTATLGAALNLGEAVSLGVSYENFIKGDTEYQKLARPVVGVGLALRAGIAAFAGDMVIDTRSNQKQRVTYHVGGEYIVYQLVALRLGFHTEEPSANTPQSKNYFMSGGLGLVSDAASINISAQRSLGAAGTWEMVAGVQFFL